jgi:DNA-directed RNA polymerase specialized sigma24 family protein
MPVMDREQIIELYDRHARELVGFFTRRTGDPQLALDLLDETFLTAFEQRWRCRARDDQPAGGLAVPDRRQQAKCPLPPWRQ